MTKQKIIQAIEQCSECGNELISDEEFRHNLCENCIDERIK